METPVIDFHNHVGSWGKFGLDDAPARYLRVMDAAGVDRACINCIFYGDARRGNDLVARFMAEHPDRFIGAAFVTPHYPEEVIPELERCFDQLGMKFLKIYPRYYGKRIDTPGWTPIFEWCNERGVVVMTHAREVFEPPITIMEKFEKLTKLYPRIKWVLAHQAYDGRPGEENVDVTLAFPNIYLETARDLIIYGGMERLVESIGADRIIYGSDMTIFDARLEVAKITTANISADAKRKILGLNAMRLLGLE